DLVAVDLDDLHRAGRQLGERADVDLRGAGHDAAASSSSHSAWWPSEAPFTTLSDSSAHFRRVAEMSIPSSSRMNSLSSRNSSSTDFPTSSSDSIDADACEIAQPCPENATSSTFPSSPTLNWTLSSSPHSGLTSSNSRSAFSSSPQWWGRL